MTADALAMLMDRATRNGLVKEVLEEHIENSVNMLQYADDTIFLLEDDFGSAHNLKFILCLFEQMFVLKINFIKVSCFCLKRLVIKQMLLLFSHVP